MRFIFPKFFSKYSYALINTLRVTLEMGAETQRQFMQIFCYLYFILTEIRRYKLGSIRLCVKPFSDSHAVLCAQTDGHMDVPHTERTTRSLQLPWHPVF